MILTTSDPICIARDPASLATEWSELARHRARPTIFLTPEWLAVARAHDRRAQITLSVLGGRGIAALACDDDGTLGFAGGELTDEQDVIARAADVAPVAAALGHWIAAQHVTRIRMDFVPEESGMAEPLGEALRGARYEVAVDRLVTSPRLSIPDTFEAYVRHLGKKERHELRRKMRRLETGRRVEFRFADARDRAAVLDRFIALHRRSRGEKAEFMTESMERYFRDVADATARRDWLRLGVLDVDGDDVAVLFGFAYEGTLALYNAAYDPAFASLSVGIVAHAYAIRAAVEEHMHTYDLLRGDEPYKYDLGGEDHWLLRIEATAP
jgi:CelD/BcsL family acetyltransferase involved in cellulose biosynthesis